MLNMHFGIDRFAEKKNKIQKQNNNETKVNFRLKEVETEKNVVYKCGQWEVDKFRSIKLESHKIRKMSETFLQIDS